LVTYYVLFFIRLENRRVEIAGVTRHPAEGWMQQIARNMTLRTARWVATVLSSPSSLKGEG
jgi:hypothetical protein